MCWLQSGVWWKQTERCCLHADTFVRLGCREEFYGLSHSEEPMLCPSIKAAHVCGKELCISVTSAGLVLSVCSLLHWGKNSLWDEHINEGQK